MPCATLPCRSNKPTITHWLKVPLSVPLYVNTSSNKGKKMEKEKLSLCTYAMKAYGGSISLTSALAGCEWAPELVLRRWRSENLKIVAPTGTQTLTP
jgi:hypothetical protein